MISIKKDKLQPKVLNNNWIQSELLEIKDKPNSGELIKSKYSDEEVKVALNNLYNNKCAYCEGLTNTAKFASRIDHYRPKNGIRVGKNKIENHKGYYWLGYEWTNLLPTCEKCSIKKSNQFPLKDESTRISDNLAKEGFLVNNEFIFDNFKIEKLNKEKRLLLNPEIDEVEKHLYFLPNGEISHLTEEGEKSIEVYDLNRSSLIYERKKIIDDLIGELLDILITYSIDYKSLSMRINEFFET